MSPRVARGSGARGRPACTTTKASFSHTAKLACLLEGVYLEEKGDTMAMIRIVGCVTNRYLKKI